jgi:signal transduction histidine kinase
MDDARRPSQYSARELRDLLERSRVRTTRRRVRARRRVPTPRLSRLERLLDLSRRMNGIRRQDELLAYIRERLHEFFEAENSQVVLLGEDGTPRSLDAEAGADPEISRAVLRRVLAGRKPLLVRDARRDPELARRSSVRGMHLTSLLCAPLVVDGEVLGVVHFDHRDDAVPFGDEDLALLGLFANQAATALQNVLLAEQREEALARMRDAQGRLATGERLRVLGQMAAGVAHDFNNLLTSILGLTELVRLRGDVPEDVSALLERLRGCAVDGAATVRRLQGFVGTPARRAEPEAVYLDDVAREVADRNAGSFADAQAGHVLSLDLHGPDPVLGRPSELREVVTNFLVNALDAMDEPGRVTLRTLERDGRSVLEVEDTGPGVPPEVRERIFEPFFSTKGGRGRGLGLAICWGLVNRMGGAIDVRSAPERGSVFALVFPPAPDARPAARPDTKRRAPAGGATRVMVVDDDPLVREVLVGMLQALGHRTLEAESGPAALARLPRSRCGVVLTDYGMPGMDGLQLAREVRRRWPRLPVVLLTGLHPALPRDVGEAVTLTVGKPIGSRELAEAVDTARARAPQGPRRRTRRKRTRT